MKTINEKGQALLFVIISLTIALAVGVSVSLRTLSSVSRTSRSDTSTRVLAAAEGGAERFMVRTDLADLANAALGNSCPDYNTAKNRANCIVTFSPTDASDTITARAVVYVRPVSNVANIEFKVPKNEVREVNLVGYNTNVDIKICWASLRVANNYASDLYLMTYGLQGVNYTYNKLGVRSSCSAGTCYPANYTSNRKGFVAPDATTDAGFDSCVTITRAGSNRILSNGSEGLRIRSLVNDSRIKVSTTTTFPLQGYEITSVGELSQESGVKSTKIVKVNKSLPYLPAIFDFALYSEGAVN